METGGLYLVQEEKFTFLVNYTVSFVFPDLQSLPSLLAAEFIITKYKEAEKNFPGHSSALSTIYLHVYLYTLVSFIAL